jgi:predicted P-loop ATPase
LKYCKEVFKVIFPVGTCACRFADHNLFSAALENANRTEYTFSFHFLDIIRQSLKYFSHLPWQAFIDAKECPCKVFTPNDILKTIENVEKSRTEYLLRFSKANQLASSFPKKKRHASSEDGGSVSGGKKICQQSTSSQQQQQQQQQQPEKKCGISRGRKH